LRSTLATAAATTLALAASASAEVITPKFKAKAFRKGQAITNRYYPLVPGTVYSYSGRREGKVSTDTLEVTHRTRKILGVTTTVIADRGYLNGVLHEKTTDWYAQDRQGNVWYFGEATETLKPNGERESTEGTWKAGQSLGKGKGTARPGIFMPAKPALNVGYKQELAAALGAEDTFEVESTKATVSVPYLTTTRGLKTRELSPLEPGVLDNKIFAPGIGTVLEVTVKGGEDRVELIKVKRP